MSFAVHRDLAQRSPEWYGVRLGMVTASMVGRLITPATLKVADNETSRKVAITLAAERITGYAEPERLSSDMWRGIDEEPLARDAYSQHLSPVTECGFMVRDDWGYRIGYSPDGLIGDLGLLEIKSRNHHIHIASIISDSQVPPAVMAQLQCGLLVSGRAWIDYVSYSAGLHLWVQRIYPQPAWHKAILAAAEATEERIAEVTAAYLSRVEGLPIMEPAADLSEIQIGA